MNTNKIVITGAPSTGKTVLIDSLERQGYSCYHEVIRTLTAEARKEGTSKPQVSNPLVFVDDPYKFNKFLIEKRLEHLLDADEAGNEVAFFDRGTGDVLAYMDFFDQKYGASFENICKKHRYDQIFILPPWREIYKRDNERLETFEQAEELHTHLAQTYSRFGYTPIEVPKTSIENRIDFITESLKSK